MLPIKGGPIKFKATNAQPPSLLQKRTREPVKEEKQTFIPTKKDETAPEIKPAGVKKTAAQMAHDRIREKRLLDRGSKAHTMSYREKIDVFNRGLSNVPEHNDVPKVGPG